MSRCTPVNRDFISDIKNMLRDYSCRLGGYYSDDIKVYYDGDKYSKRDYVINVTVRNWTAEDSKYLKMRLRDLGATNIIGCVRHAIARDYIDWAFDIKQSRLKEVQE